MEEEQESKKQRLLDMGFALDLSIQALSATGSVSSAAAANWILSNRHQFPSISNPNPTPSPNQLKIHKFFQSHPPKPNSPTPPVVRITQESDTTSPPPSERMKPLVINQVVGQGHIFTQNTLPIIISRHNKTQESNALSPPKPLSETPEIAQVVGQDHILSPKTLPIKRKTRVSDLSSPPEPLSERMRPRSIKQVVGQDHILAQKTLLKSAIDCDRLPSLILWGPPGTGKTSIARAIVSRSLSCTYRFVSLSAVTSGVKDIRDAVEEAKKLKVFSKKRTVLFIDEVHRFNKSQQDSFLPVIEDGSVVFMGATTENPSFHLITPLLSRCKVLTLNPLGPDHIATLLRRAVSDTERGLLLSVRGLCSVSGIEVNDAVIQFLASHCDGDARVALNALEMSAITAAAGLIAHQAEGENHVLVNDYDDSVSIARVTLEDAKEALQNKHIIYDKAGEEHYNLISALHKSMRGNDADAAIYWLARMLEGGEEPLYISRRLIRFASEDIGLADPLALPQAVACYQACHFIGMPECNVCLTQCVAYLSLAPKSVSVYKAIEAAKKVVTDSVAQNPGVPLHLRNAPTKLMKELGYGKEYIYPPDNSSTSSQAYLPKSLQGYKFLHWPDKTDH